MAGKSFQADVDRIFINTEKKLDFVMKQSVMRSINEMQLPGPSKASISAAIKDGLGASGRGKNRKLVQGPITAPGKGGRMRVDTGFLRASGQLSFNGMPTGPSQRPEDAKADQFKWVKEPVEAKIKGAKLGVTIYWGWTANYARYREKYDGFMETVLQKWQQTVDSVVEEAKARFK